MSNSDITYLGPVTTGSSSPKRKVSLKNLPWGFIAVVGVPSLVSSIYLAFIAAPQYVSEAQFIVRSPSQPQMTGLGVALQGMGFANQSTDAFAVHNFITSRDGLAAIQKDVPVKEILSRPEADFLSSYPRVFEGKSEEALYKAMSRYVTVGYDSQTGISTLRVKSFRSEDAQTMARAMLNQGEILINKLNQRAIQNALDTSQNRLIQANEKLVTAQQALNEYRRVNGTIDPAREAQVRGEVVSGLMASVAQLEAEKTQLQRDAPDSPLLAQINSRLQGLRQQIAVEEGKIVGSDGALSAKIGTYERLMLQAELAAREVTASNAAVESARQDAVRQQLYLETIAAPSKPDKATEPRRLKLFLTVLMSCLLIYGCGWLVWASLREHRQA